MQPLVPRLEDLVDRGSSEERWQAADLLTLCAQADETVKSRVLADAHRWASNPVTADTGQRLLGWLRDA